ncbi:MAG: alpha-mannosidase, partial [Paracoccaceae bacterium]
TYSNVLRLMAAHDDYVFSHSQPQLYDYTAIDTPELFDDIRTRVREGRWEIMGGMWVEPDVNMPGSESLVRQILLGRQYFTETFGAGVETPVLWLPDTFGFPACLPQLMAQAGLRWFVTNKLNWNQINRMPASTFWWDGIDGSRVMAHVLTTPREVQHLPFPTNYKSDLTAPEVLGTWAHATARDATRSLPICYGYGDGGGGPTDDLIRRARAWAEMPGAPRVEMATVRTALEALEATAGDAPVWAGELYMEGHRGTLTSQGWIKQANRLAEATLSEVETLVVMRWPGGAPADVRAELTRLWRVLCLNQFHDILTGTAVEQVFDDARADFATIMSGCASLRSRCHSVMAGACAANLSPLPSSELVSLKPGLPLAGTKGPCPEQSIEGGRLVAVPRREGRSVLPLTHSAQAGQVSAPVTTGQDADGLWMRNAHVMVRLTAQGAITAITDLRHDRQILAPGTIGNQLTAFEDRPISWDAWDIDPFFEDRPTDLHPTSAIWTETGPLRATLRVVTQWGCSTITQDIRLMHHSARVQFDTEVDWHAQHILLKTAFATQIHSPRATYDIQWGQVERPTHRNTPRDAAQFEVAAQRWVDLSEPDYGVALLNTGKYGHDVRGGVMRLSLLKSATSPDPTADQGRHSFGYALLPHAADRPQVQAEARAMIHPTRVSGLDYGGAPLAPEVAPLVHVNRDHVILETVKPAEDGRGFILRLYEAEGRRGTIEITFGLPIEHVSQVDLLEQDGSALKVARALDGAPDAALGRAKVTLSVTPFQIVTLR